jgi:hypothetical protein
MAWQFQATPGPKDEASQHNGVMVFHAIDSCAHPGLVDNPDLRVVLLFVYEAYKTGGARFLNQVLEPLAKSKALIAGGIVENVFSPPRQW